MFLLNLEYCVLSNNMELVHVQFHWLSNIPVPFEASKTAVVITAAAIIDIAVTKTPSHIFRLDTLFTGMCSTSLSISYICNNEIITRALIIKIIIKNHKYIIRSGDNFVLDIKQPVRME